MIVRIWRATATVPGAEQYRHHFEHNVIPDLRRIDGFRKAFLLTRTQSAFVDIEVHTLWESLEAIRGFASPDMEAAVVEPQAQKVLTTYETTVSHYEAREYD